MARLGYKSWTGRFDLVQGFKTGDLNKWTRVGNSTGFRRFVTSICSVEICILYFRKLFRGELPGSSYPVNIISQNVTMNLLTPVHHKTETSSASAPPRNPLAHSGLSLCWDLMPSLRRPFVIFTVSQFMVRNDSVSDGFMNSRGKPVCAHSSYPLSLRLLGSLLCFLLFHPSIFAISPWDRQILLRTWNLDKQSLLVCTFWWCVFLLIRGGFNFFST